MNYIQIKTPIPGPKSQEVLRRRSAATPSGLGKATEVVSAKAKGSLVEDIDGNTFIDFTAGIGMLNAGHCPQPVIEAVKEQLDKMIHNCFLVSTTEPYVELAEILNQITPGLFAKKTIFMNSGSEAVETAVGIAKYATKRNAIICFEAGYHGRTMMALSLTSKYSLFKKGFGTFASDVIRLPAPHPYRVPDGMTPEQYLQHCIAQFENAFITQIDGEAVAAIIIEPVQGEGGFIQIPEAFLMKIREICDKHKIVMIADEIQSGFGRTGKLFAIQHTKVVPDMITMAKSLGAGFPIAAVTGKVELMDAPHLGGLGGTYGGSPIAVRAAIESVKIINDAKFLSQANVIGNIIEKRLTEWYAKYEPIGDVRGIGAMRIIEFVKDRKTKTPDTDINLAVVKEAYQNGLLTMRAGIYSNCVRLLPALNIPEDILNEGLDVLGKAIAKCSKK